MNFGGGADFSNVFKLVNLAVAVVAVLGGVSQFFPVGFQSSIIAVYVILFGLGIGLLEFQVPPRTNRYASFMFSFVGRGVFYAFIGTILLHDHILRIIAGSIIALVGLGYIALEFIPSIEPPESMRAPDSSLDYENATDTL